MNRLRSTWLVPALATLLAATGANAQAKGPSASPPAKNAPSASAQAKAAPSANASPKDAPSAAPATDAPEDRTRKLFEDGTMALNAGRFGEAEEKLRAAWALKKSFDVAGNLGAALLKLGKHVEAAWFLAYAADNFPVGGKPAVLRWVEELLAEATKEIVTLRISVNEPGADLTVNGSEAGKSPVAGRTFAAPGAIVVEAHKNGFEDVRVKLTGEKGSTVDAPLMMKAKGATPSPGPNRLPAYVAFGAGGVGLVLGAIAGAASMAALGDVNAACGGTKNCPSSQRNAVSTGGTLADVSTVGFVVAGVGAAVGVTLWLVPIGGSGPARTAVTIGPAFVGVKGAF